MKTSHEDGFSLAETLIALMVVSLALGAVIAATTLVNRFYHRQNLQSVAMRQVDGVTRSLDKLVRAQSATMVGTVSGDGHGFTYGCDGGATCTFSLAKTIGLQLVYTSGGKSYTSWPVSTSALSSENDNNAPQLEAFILQDARHETVGVVRFETEQGRACQYDLISRTCR